MKLSQPTKYRDRYSNFTWFVSEIYKQIKAIGVIFFENVFKLAVSIKLRELLAPTFENFGAKILIREFCRNLLELVSNRSFLLNI